jgi:hypothetical protein
MVESHPSRGLLRVVPPAALEAALSAEAKERAQAQTPVDTAEMTGLAGMVRTKFETFKRHRDNTMSGWSYRLLKAMRAFNGQYDPVKLAEIQKFGGSTVYARLIAVKCRGASSLLRDVYLSPDRPWALDPNQDPSIPPEIIQAIQKLLSSELQGLAQAGQPIDPAAIRDRHAQLITAAREAAKKKAADQANIAEEKLDEILVDGGFYKALAEFITDLPLFPFACIKGPVVRIVPTVTWLDGKAQVTERPRLFWNRTSPFDIWWTPGVADIEDAEVIERTRVTRADLNDLLDLPGYNAAAIREVLDLYGSGGLVDDWDYTDAERAVQENRENPQYNRSGLIACLEYHGNVQGKFLIEAGMDPRLIQDPVRDYFVQCWVIGQYVIKTQLSPSPRKRHPYFVSSFEKVPGTPVGNGLPDILDDIQEVCNATLRGLVNNLSISSGPQVVVMDDRLSPDEDGEDMYPWKRWHVQSDPLGGGGQQKPIDFFQPQSNAQELLQVYQQFTAIADDLSAIPKYMSGANAGPVGRTASGLAMLMSNAAKILQTVAANVDRDVMAPLLQNLFDMLMLTDQSGILTGEETVRVMGVNVAVQKETQRSRQLEFLQLTGNPIDMSIIGPKGRANILRSVAQTLGLPGEEIVPSDSELEQQQAQAAQAQQAQAQQAAQAQGNQPPKGGNVTGDTGPRTNIAGGPQ